MYEYFPAECKTLIRPKKHEHETASEHDFIRRCVSKYLKRMRKFVLAFNTLLMHKKRTMLAEICSHIKIFITDICDLFIDKLKEFDEELTYTIKRCQYSAEDPYNSIFEG